MQMRRLKVKPLYRTVFDTNVYVAKALSKNPRSPNRELFELLKDEKYVLIWCEEIRAEVVEKLLARGLNGERIAELIAEVMGMALYIQVPASAIRGTSMMIPMTTLSWRVPSLEKPHTS